MPLTNMSVDTASSMPLPTRSSAASSPTPSTGTLGVARVEVTLDQIKFRHALPQQFCMSETEGYFGRQFDRTNLRGQLVQHAVDELVSVRAAKGLGEFHRFVDHHAIGNFGMMRQLICAQQQHGKLDRD